MHKHEFKTKVLKSVKRKASEVKLQHNLCFTTKACKLTSKFA